MTAFHVKDPPPIDSGADLLEASAFVPILVSCITQNACDFLRCLLLYS